MIEPIKIRQDSAELMDKLEFPKEAQDFLLDALDKLLLPEYFGELSDIISLYYESENCAYSNMLSNMKKLSKRVEIHEYTGDMLMLICMVPKLRERYAERGIPEKIFYDTIADLKYKLSECMDLYGIIGMFVAFWYPGFFNLTRFALGRLQFEVREIGISCEYNQKMLSSDTLGLNIHIPRTGGKLSREQVLESYQMACEFYKDQFHGEPILFFCTSWLLDPWNLNVLPEGSNLYNFIKDFTIVEIGEFGDYTEAWRIFDKIYDGNVDALPQNTSLQRAYSQRIRRGEKMRWAKGVFVM